MIGFWNGMTKNFKKHCNIKQFGPEISSMSMILAAFTISLFSHFLELQHPLQSLFELVTIG